MNEKDFLRQKKPILTTIRTHLVLPFCSLLAVGCSSGQGGAPGSGGTPGGGGSASGGMASGGAGPGSGGTTPGTGGGGGAALYGTINVELVPDDPTTFTEAHGGLSTLLYGAPSPESPMTVQETMEGCQLLVPAKVSCDPVCDGSSLCTAANQCTPKPKAQNVGVLHVSGLKTTGGDTSFDVEASKSYFYTSDTLPYPPCAEGDVISVQNDGTLTVSGKCIAPLTVTSQTPIPFVDAQKRPIAGTITWTAPGQPGLARIELILEISHHAGGSKGQITCDVPDTGSFSIPQKLVADLIALGRAGYPTIEVNRVSTASAAGAPGVELRVNTSYLLEVDTGVVSCGGGDDTDPVQCPTGTTCSNGPPYLCQ